MFEKVSTFLNIFVYVAYVICYNTNNKESDYMRYWDWMDWVVATLMGIMVVLVILVVIVMYQQNKECEQQGGHMVGNGKYHTVWVSTGKSMFPTITEEMECRK
jgi:SNF family Na+-dependent transporter